MFMLPNALFIVGFDFFSFSPFLVDGGQK
jgi:hypothetical protein